MLDVKYPGYLKEFIDGIRTIKDTLNINRILLAYPSEGVAEFIMLSDKECDFDTLCAVNNAVTQLIKRIDESTGLSVDACTEVSSCDIDSIIPTLDSYVIL